MNPSNPNPDANKEPLMPSEAGTHRLRGRSRKADDVHHALEPLKEAQPARLGDRHAPGHARHAADKEPLMGARPAKVGEHHARGHALHADLLEPRMGDHAASMEDHHPALSPDMGQRMEGHTASVVEHQGHAPHTDDQEEMEGAVGPTSCHFPDCDAPPENVLVETEEETMMMRHGLSSCTELCKLHYNREFKFYTFKNTNCQMKDVHPKKVNGVARLSFEEAKTASSRGKYAGIVFPDMSLCNRCNIKVKEEIASLELDSPDLVSVSQSQQSTYSDASSVKRFKSESVLTCLNDLLASLDISTVKDKDKR